MKIQVTVLEAKEGYSASGWGADSGHVTILKGETKVLEGVSVSVSGVDGVGKNEVASADGPSAGP